MGTPGRGKSFSRPLCRSGFSASLPAWRGRGLRGRESHGWRAPGVGGRTSSFAFGRERGVSMGSGLGLPCRTSQGRRPRRPSSRPPFAPAFRRGGRSRRFPHYEPSAASRLRAKQSGPLPETSSLGSPIASSGTSCASLLAPRTVRLGSCGGQMEAADALLSHEAGVAMLRTGASDEAARRGREDGQGARACPRRGPRRPSAGCTACSCSLPRRSPILSRRVGA